MISLVPEKTEAQIGTNGKSSGRMGAVPIMGIYTPTRFRLTGLIELTYWDYSSKTKQAERSFDTKTTIFEQRYRLGIQGYIWDPRLAFFSTSVGLSYRKTGYKKPFESELTSKDITYDLSMSIFPFRPFPIDLYATRITATAESRGTEPYDATTNSYGIALRLTPLKFPHIRIYYDHWDLSSGRDPGKRENDRYGLNIKGSYLPLRTRYNWRYELLNYSSPARSYTSSYLVGDMSTILKKENILYTSFQYSKIDVSKLLSFTAGLQLSPIKRFDHGYSYGYYRSEGEGTRSDSHNLNGIFGYRFSERLIGRGELRYTRDTRDGVNQNFYNIGIGLNYWRPIRDLDFTSGYDLAYSGGGKGREILTNRIGLGLATRKLKWGKIYSNYRFTYQTTDQGDATEHSLIVGAAGRGPGRAFWRIEGEYYNSRNERGGGRVVIGQGSLEFGVLGAVETSYYSLSGEINYPLGRKALVTFASNYTIGTTDTGDIERFYYEGRFNYLIFRNLAFLAYWKEEWNRIGGDGVDAKTREFQVQVNYRFRRVFISAEYRLGKTKIGSTTTELDTLYLKLSRPI